MSENTPAVPDETPLTDDDILRFTQGTRKALIKEMVKHGYPQDPKEQRVLLTALSDMDRTALGNKRITADEAIAESDRQAAVVISKINEQLGGRNPFRREGEVIEGKAERISESDIPAPQLVPGETDIGISDMNYEEFIKKMEPEE